MVKLISSTIRDVFLNLNPGMISFAAQRVTGILLAFYLVVHIFVLSSAIRGGQSFDGLIKGLASPLTHVCEILLITGVMFHLFNGIRIMVADLLGSTRAQVEMLAVCVILTAGAFGVAVWAYLPRFAH